MTNLVYAMGVKVHIDNVHVFDLEEASQKSTKSLTTFNI